MCNKICILFFWVIVLPETTFCQTKVASPTVNIKVINADHDRMYRIMLMSDKVVIPDSTIMILKDFAKQKGYRELAVLKSGVILKPLYNNEVSKTDKLFVCKIISKMCESQYSTIPLSLIINIISQINKIH